MEPYWKDILEGHQASADGSLIPEYWIARAAAQRVGWAVLGILQKEAEERRVDAFSYEKVRKALADEIAPD